MTRWTLAGLTAVAAISAVAVFDVGVPAAGASPSEIISSLSDPVGDTKFHSSPAFQDIAGATMTKTAAGDFELLMEMDGAVPVAPELPSQAHTQIWWMWFFDLDPTTFPQGYPSAPGVRSPLGAEFSVQIRWDGTEFLGVAVDRRPLLTGGEAIVTPIAFDIDGTQINAVLPSTLIGDVPASFRWGAITIDWAGPVGTNGHTPVDFAEAVFNP